jgi:hypothetical protein
MAVLTSKELEQSTNGSALYISICLTSLTLLTHTFNNLEKYFCHIYPIHCADLQTSHNSHPSITYFYVVALINFIYSSIQVPDVLVLTARCKLISFAFRILPPIFLSWNACCLKVVYRLDSLFYFALTL